MINNLEIFFSITALTLSHMEVVNLNYMKNEGVHNICGILVRKSIKPKDTIRTTFTLYCEAVQVNLLVTFDQLANCPLIEACLGYCLILR
jgi:hypothetical protein